MKPMLRRSRPVVLLAVLAALVLAAGAAAQTSAATSIALSLDASQVAQRILHVRSEIPVAPGPLTLLYPKWIPGEHGPTGPLVNLVDLRLSAGGKEIAWERDPVEMYALHVTIPPGATRLSTQADFLFPAEGGSFSAGPGATDFLAVISWNTVALYPQGPSAEAIRVTPTLRLPAGWSFATALVKQGEEGGTVQFAPVSLSTLIDSPVLTGTHLMERDLGEHAGARHHLAIAADRAADLAGAGDLSAPMSR